jgi:hypothetical protein
MPTERLAGVAGAIGFLTGTGGPTVRTRTRTWRANYRVNEWQGLRGSQLRMHYKLHGPVTVLNVVLPVEPEPNPAPRWAGLRPRVIVWSWLWLWLWDLPYLFQYPGGKPRTRVQDPPH